MDFLKATLPIVVGFYLYLNISVESKALENEAIKLMLVKEGLLNMSSCYLELTDKASIIFQAHREVTNSLPDVHDRDIEDIRYSGIFLSTILL